MKKILIKKFISYPKTIPKILKEVNLAEKIKNKSQILIKPNLTLADPPSMHNSVGFSRRSNQILPKIFKS